MTGYERTPEDARAGEGRAEECGEREGKEGFCHRRITAVGRGYPMDVYGEPIFSFDYSTRANASQLSRQLHLTEVRSVAV